METLKNYVFVYFDELSTFYFIKISLNVSVKLKLFAKKKYNNKICIFIKIELNITVLKISLNY